MPDDEYGPVNGHPPPRRKEEIVEPHCKQGESTPQREEQHPEQRPANPEGLCSGAYRLHVMPPPETIQAFAFLGADHACLRIGVVAIAPSNIFG